MSRPVVDHEALTLAGVVKDIIEVREALKAQDASEAQIAHTTGRMLRERWPNGRPWKYVCDDCSDTGWKFGICTSPGMCGRPFSLPGRRPDDYTGQGKCGENHTYVVPCHCQRGAVRRAGLERRPTTEDFASAGKVAKQPTRFGR